MRSFILFLIFSVMAAIQVRGQSTPDLEATICEGDTAVMTASVTDADSLQWYRDGLPVANSNNDTLFAFENGIYYLKAFRGQCFDVSGDIRIFMAYPRANDDYISASLGELTNFDVLANDEAVCAPFDRSTFMIVSPPSIGTLVSSDGGHIIYKPPPAVLGIDRFTYRVKDIEGRLTNEALVTIQLYIDCAFVYPNPVEDWLNVVVNNKKIYALVVTDALGREVYRTAVNSIAVQVDMQGLAQGIYMVKLLEHGGDGCAIRVQKK